jgi:hypothetical protein
MPMNSCQLEEKIIIPISINYPHWFIFPFQCCITTRKVMKLTKDGGTQNETSQEKKKPISFINSKSLKTF